MKRLITLAALLFVVSFSSAQTFDYFFKPRPPLDFSVPKAVAGVPVSEWQVHPTVDVNFTEVRFKKGENPRADFFQAAGFGLTFQNTVYDDNGFNYARYSVSLDLLMSGSSLTSPFFTTQICLFLGALINLVNLGVGWDLTGPRLDGFSRASMKLGLKVNLTNN